MKSSGFRSLRVRLASLVLLTMALVTGLIVASYVHERSHILDQMGEDFTRLVTVIASDQEQLIARTRQFLITLAKTPEIESVTPGTCPDFLNHLIDEYPRYTSIGVLDNQGVLLCGAGRLTPYGAFVKEPWFMHSVRARDFSMGPLLSGVEDDGRFVIGYPTTGDDREVRTVVFATVDLSQFSELIAHLQPPRQVKLMMISHKGNILNCMPSREDCAVSARAMDSLLRAMLQKGTGTVQAGDSGESDSLYAFAPLSSTVDTGLFVSISVPVSSLYTKANRMLAYQFAGIWALTLLALGLVWFGSSALIIGPVDAMVLTAQRLSRGDLDARTGLPHRGGELDSLAQALDEMAEALESRSSQVLRYETELRSMASQLTSVEERERRRLAEVLHDRVGQLLGISKIKMGMLLQAAPNADTAALASEIRAYIVEALDETRSLTFEISPPILYEIGLEAALEYLAERVRDRNGLDVTYSDDGQSKALPEDARVLLYRAASELLSNVVKHARASHVVLSTELKEQMLVLTVEDDGVGFEAKTDGTAHRSGNGYGLFSIRERFRHKGGGVSIESSPGHGCRVILTIPTEDPA
ncbi:MAG: cache domain-containing protein [Syntrophobacteraceae bacterium]